MAPVGRAGGEARRGGAGWVVVGLELGLEGFIRMRGQGGLAATWACRAAGCGLRAAGSMRLRSEERHAREGLAACMHGR